MKNKELNDFMLSLIDHLEREQRFGTAHVYNSTLNAFTGYWKNSKRAYAPMQMRDVFTVSVLQDFELYLKNKQLKLNTVSTYLRMLRAVYYRALHEEFVSYIAGLFDRLYTGTRADVKRALSCNEMAHILPFPALESKPSVAVHSFPSQDEGLAEARNWFSLLFFLRGMPFADLARLRKCDYQKGVISYCRQKTGKRLVVVVPPEAEPLLRACADRRADSPYLLSILSGPDIPQLGSRDEYIRYQHVLRGFNYRLAQLSQMLGLGCRLSSYTARHTWATIAYRKKCAVGIISNALGHSSIKVTETYLKPFEMEELDRTNRKIISYVKETRCNKGINGIATL